MQAKTYWQKISVLSFLRVFISKHEYWDILNQIIFVSAFAELGNWVSTIA